MPLKKPQSYFTEKETLQKEAQKKELNERKRIQENKRLRSPKKALGEIAGVNSAFVTRKPQTNIQETVEEIVEKIEQVSDDTPNNIELLERLSGVEKAITKLHIEKLEKGEVLSLYESIEELKEIVSSIHIPETIPYDEEVIDGISENIVNLKEDISGNISSLDEQVNTKITESYRNLNDSLLKNRTTYEALRCRVDDFVIPDINSNSSNIDELKELHQQLKEAVDNLPNQESRFDPTNILDSLSNLRESISLTFDRCNELDKKYDRIPGVKDYTEDLDLLQNFISEVKDSIQYYDTDVIELKESIFDLGKHLGKTINDKVKSLHEEVRKELSDEDKKLDSKLSKKIKALPEVKYYDDEINLIEGKINRLLNTITELPEVKYYDNDIKSLSKAIDKLNTKIDKIEIPDWTETINRIQNDVLGMQEIQEEFDEKINEAAENVVDPYSPEAMKDYVTFDKMQEHYRGFLNRIQQQLASLGGGGAVRIMDMDDLDEDVRQNPQDYNGDFLRLDYDPVTKQVTFIADSGGDGGGGPIATPELGDLLDVDTSAQADGFILVYIASTGKWEAKPVQYIGVNIDANPDPEIQDYGDYEFGSF